MKSFFLIGLVVSSLAQAQDNSRESFVPIPRNYTFQNSTVIENMPPVRSQDSIGICGAFALAAVLDYNNCQKNKWDCTKLTDDRRVSTLDIARAGSAMGLNDIYEAEDKSKLKRVVIGEFPLVLGTVTSALTKSVAKESCAPFSRIVNRFSDDDVNQQKKVDELEKRVSEYTEGQSGCIECVLNLVKNDFPGINDLQKVRESLDMAKADFSSEGRSNSSARDAGSSRPTGLGFELFLKNLLIKNQCDKPENSVPVEGFLESVEMKKDQDNAKEFESYIAFHLNKKRPLIISGICFDKSLATAEGCKENHAAVIVGEATRCAPSGNRCRKAYKIHNSWGQSWQNSNSDGWVFAENLMSRTIRIGRSPLIVIKP
ncbi:MAG: hypothetical protein LW875_06875 [Proteobacteria bacterium]|jgi:hypothetical protein|nr:hypothetical protein [Pseudomonadota bacterium]